jgi:hypothetical protein
VEVECFQFVVAAITFYFLARRAMPVDPAVVLQAE